MAYTCSDIISQITARLKDASISNGTLLQFINDANREVCNRYQWDFLQETTTFDTVASTNQYALSSIASDLQKLVSLRITSPTDSEQWLTPLTAEQFDRYNATPANDSEGVPTYYYLWENVVYVYPTPDDAYTISVRYIKTPTTLESADQPDIPEEFQEVVMLGALYRAMQTNDNFDQSVVIKSQFDTQVVDMVKRLMPFPSGAPKVMPTSSPKRRLTSGSIL